MSKHNFRVAINLIIKQDNKILLMRRYNTGWNDGMYALMGGHVESAENPYSTVIREAKEELGITIKKKDLKHLLTMTVNPDHIYLYFMCSEFEGKITNMEKNQCDDIRFFNINELPNNLIDADKLAINTILKEKSISFKTFGYDNKE